MKDFQKSLIHKNVENDLQFVNPRDSYLKALIFLQICRMVFSRVETGFLEIRGAFVLVILVTKNDVIELLIYCRELLTDSHYFRLNIRADKIIQIKKKLINKKIRTSI
jgi:hypothetical protein